MTFARAVLALAASALALLAQDTRTVTEPAIPPVCAVLSAQLIAGATGLPAASETQFDTGRIQNALNGCAAGNAVELAAGGPNNAFLVGPITLPKGVTLLVDAGVTVFASRNPHDYDLSPSANVCGTITANGGACMPLITANHADGAGIMGYGTIDGRGYLPMLVNGASSGTSWWDLARQAQAVSQNQNNPRMLQVNNTNGFTLYKITLRNSPFFHVALGTDTNFTAWGVKIITPYDARNTDGIDPGYSSNVTITECHISDGDDQVAVGGNNPPGATNISVVNNFFGSGHGASIGSYTQNGVSNLLVDHIVFAGDSADSSSTGLRIKSDVSRGGLVQNITYSNICMQNVRAPIVLDPFYTAGATRTLIPRYQNITMRNVNSTTEGTVKIEGHDASVPTTITLDNVQVTGIKSSDITEQYATYTLGPGPVNFAPLLKGTGVNVVNNVSNQDPPYSCPASIFSPIAGELIPGARELAAHESLAVTVQVFPTKAVPYQTYLNNLQTNPNATLNLTPPTGTVTIYDGAIVVGSASLGAGQLLSVPIAGLAPGPHTLTASYSGDGTYSPITFGSYTLSVCAPYAGRGGIERNRPVCAEPRRIEAGR
jgi:polygalacturonase